MITEAMKEKAVLQVVGIRRGVATGRRRRRPDRYLLMVFIANGCGIADMATCVGMSTADSKPN